jgi:hypothetical protein
MAVKGGLEVQPDRGIFFRPAWAGRSSRAGDTLTNNISFLFLLDWFLWNSEFDSLGKILSEFIWGRLFQIDFWKLMGFSVDRVRNFL